MLTILKPVRMTSIAVLAIIMMATASFAVSGETPEVPSAETTVGDSASAATTEVVLYYFHGTRRCNTCKTIESYAHEAVEEKFQDALQAGTLQWTTLNTEEAENAHFVKDFGLVSSSLVLVKIDGGEVRRHEVLQDAWTLVRDKPRFVEYVQGSVGEFLK